MRQSNRTITRSRFSIGLSSVFTMLTGTLIGCTNPSPRLGLPAESIEAVATEGQALGAAEVMNSVEDWSIAGTATGSRFGRGLAIGDLNCDGFGDIAVGGPFALKDDDLTTPTTAFGRVNVYYGDEDDPEPSWTYTAPDRAGFGYSVLASDVNADGCGDLIVAEPGYTSAGRLSVFFGKSTGLSSTPNLRLAGGSYLDPLGAWADARATGLSLSGNGDINGDGIYDIVVGAPWSGTTARPARGAVLVYFGAPSGAPSTLATARQALSAPIHLPNNAKFGSRVAVVGDVNGDSYDDVLIAKSPDADGGGVSLHLGSASGLDYLTPWSLENIGNDLGGEMTGLGDLDGNGRAEVAISTGSSIRIYRGVPDGLSEFPTQTILAPSGESIAPNGLTSADLDMDGYQDLVLRTTTIASPSQTRIHAYRAEAWTPGEGVPYRSAPNHAWDVGPTAEGQNGPLAAGDLDGDGDADLAVGAPEAPVTSLIGKVYALAGAAFPLGDEDGDGYDALVDCDDQAWWMNDGATEFCDGYDNDCDGVVDNTDCATDNDPPVGDIRIDHPSSPDVAATAIRTVTLHIDVHDAGGPIEQMCLSATPECTSWQGFTKTLPWTLGYSDGRQTVYALFKDAHLNISEQMHFDIYLDRIAPLDGLVTATMSVVAEPTPSGTIALSWGGFNDATSGVLKYRVNYRTDRAPTSCTDGTRLTETSDVNYTHTELTLGQRYYYRVCAVDHAGNVSFGVPISKAPAAPTDASRPTGSVTINGGAVATKSGQVTLSLIALDEGDVSRMCVSNQWASCTNWRAFQTTIEWNLFEPVGTQTVYVWFQDEWNNVSARYADTIIYDPIAPTNYTFSGIGGDGHVDLTWAASIDTGTGISGYKLAWDVLPPSSCDTAIELGKTVHRYMHTGLTNGQTYFYRLCAYDMAGNQTDSTLYVLTRDRTGPAGSVIINEGETATRVTAVSLRILGTDPSGIAKMCVTNSPTSCPSWEPFATNKPWTLSAGDGNRYVYVTLEDSLGNRSTSISDFIVLDTEAPTNGLVTIAGADRELVVSWRNFKDTRSGIDKYELRYDVVPVNNCTSGTSLYSGTGTSYTHTGLVNGVTYYYRVCATDKVNNRNAGTAAQHYPAPEYTAPTGSIVLASGVAATNQDTVSVALSASDASSVTHLCLSNTSNCTSWQPYTTTATWPLSTGTGDKTVYAWFKDTWGNKSTPRTDNIVYDTVPPNSGLLTIAAGPSGGSLQASWTGASDLMSGVGNYRLIYKLAGLPEDCADGAVVYTGTANVFTHTGLPLGTLAGYRLCVLDKAGNSSMGVTGSKVALSEYASPAGTLSIDAGAYATRNDSVTLTISGSDPAGVSAMCISNSNICSSWVTYATSQTWRLSTARTGSKTVSLWLRDGFGNQNVTPVKDTIVYDPSSPTNGTVAATVSAGTVLLRWSGFSDGVGSGIDRYKVTSSTVSTPASCSAGTIGYEGTASQATMSGLTGGTPVYFRVCAIDKAGNSSTGRSIAATPD